MKPTDPSKIKGKSPPEEVDFFREEYVGENSVCRFYRNEWCLQYETHINQYDEKGITLPDRMSVYLCRPKDGESESYVAFDTKGKPYMEWVGSFDFEVKIKALKMMIADEYDLVEMARKKTQK